MILISIRDTVHKSFSIFYILMRVVILIFLLNFSSFSQSSKISWSSFNSGFDKSISSDNSLESLLGETIVGKGSSRSSNISIGFFSNPYLNPVVTGINNKQEDEGTPISYELKQNYPNPFNPSTTIEFSLPYQSNVSIIIYDILGQRTRTLLSEVRSAGNYYVKWQGDNEFGSKVGSGVYFYVIRALGPNNTSFIKYKKMILLK